MGCRQQGWAVGLQGSKCITLQAPRAPSRCVQPGETRVKTDIHGSCSLEERSRAWSKLRQRAGLCGRLRLAASVPGLGVETCLWKHRCPALPAGGVCPTPLPLVQAAVPASLPSSPIFSLWFTNPATAGVSEHFTESGQSLTLNDNRISPKLYMTLALKANTFIWIDVITGSATRIHNDLSRIRSILPLITSSL